MIADENAKEEIDGENTVFEDLGIWWGRNVQPTMAKVGKKDSKDTVTPYTVTEGTGGETKEGGGDEEDKSMFGDNHCDIEMCCDCGLVDAVNLLGSNHNGKIIRTYEEQHKMEAGSFELDNQSMENGCFIKLMIHVKRMSDLGELHHPVAGLGSWVDWCLGIGAPGAPTYTDEDVHNLVCWYHGAYSCFFPTCRLAQSLRVYSSATRHRCSVLKCKCMCVCGLCFTVRADAVVKDSQDDDEEDSKELEAISQTNQKFDALQHEVSDLSQKMDRVLAALGAGAAPRGPGFGSPPNPGASAQGPVSDIMRDLNELSSMRHEAAAAAEAAAQGRQG